MTIKYVASDKDDHFRGALIENAIASESLSMPADWITAGVQKGVISEMSFQSDQNLDWELLFWSKNEYDNTDLDLSTVITRITLAATDADQVAGSDQYIYKNPLLANIGYMDEDNSSKVHVSLINRSTTAKGAGDAGKVALRIGITPWDDELLGMRHEELTGGAGGEEEEATFESWDILVDAAGGGDTTSIDTAIGTASTATIYVKQGTYTETITGDVAGQHVYLEPGTDIVGAVTVSAADVSWEMGAGSSASLLFTWSGANGNFIMRNGCDLSEGLLASGNLNFMDGGGWGSIATGTNNTVHALRLTGDDCIVTNITSNLAAGAFLFDSLRLDGARNIATTCKVIDSPDEGLSCGTTSTDCLALGNTVLGADLNGIIVGGPASRIIGNYVIATGEQGIDLSDTGDNSVACGNICKDQAAGQDSILIDANGENCVVASNRVDDLGTSNGVADNSGTSVTGANNESAF